MRQCKGCEKGRLLARDDASRVLKTAQRMDTSTALIVPNTQRLHARDPGPINDCKLLSTERGADTPLTAA
jgi:hypothetical protein